MYPRNPDSDETKERAQFEQFPGTEWCPAPLRPGNPYHFRQYPRMLYCARQIPPGFPGAGKWAISMDPPQNFGFRTPEDWERARQAAMRFTESCQCVVNDEREHGRKRESGEGWCDSMPDAMEWRKKLEDQIGVAAAERNYTDRRMSDKAKEESAAAEAEHFGHLPVIPEKPKARRGRPPKVHPEA
jgi:hypothetical protein